MKITKVKISPASIEALDAMDKTVFPADVPYPKQGAYWWIVEDSEATVGFCGLKRWNDSTGFLCRAGVLRGFRGEGIHRKMIRVREKAARAMGISLLVTYCAGYNVKSANNLIKCGYTVYTPQAKWGCDGAIYFRKPL